MQLENDWLEHLNTCGWVSVDKLAKCWRHIPRLIKKLEPSKVTAKKLLIQSTQSARPNTLSSRYGTEAFPPHTDCPFAPVPPRYLILASTGSRLTTTHIFNTETLPPNHQENVRQAIFKVRGMDNSFYSWFKVQQRGHAFVRYNPAVMQPINNSAEELNKYICTSWPPTISIDWQRTAFSVIDNWKCLHSRGAGTTPTSSALWRYTLWGTK